VVLALDPQANFKTYWQSFKSFYSKKYSTSSQESAAFSNFQTNVMKVLQINNDIARKDWAGCNQFCDLSPADFRKTILMDTSNSTSLGRRVSWPSMVHVLRCSSSHK
jgi:hypothetical protein